MEGFLKLRLCRFPVRHAEFGNRTTLDGDTLVINRAELQALIMQDSRLAAVAVDAALPGESCRIVHVQDVIQPRTKAAGPGSVFPGFLGSGRTAGSGTTHCLTGAAVVSCGEIQTKYSAGGPSSLTGPRNRVIDMSGPGAGVTPFAETVNVVLTYQPAPAVAAQEFEAAMRLGSLRGADYLACASLGRQPAEEEAWDLPPAPGLPRVAYITLVQNDGFLRDTYLYGDVTTAATVPTIIHPAELADGVVVSASASPAAVSTYGYQDNQVVQAMVRKHGKEVDFAGVVLTTRHHMDDPGKEKRAWFAAKLAHQMGAQGAVLVRASGGNAIVDQMMCCQACTALGIKTTLVSFEISGSDGTDFPLIYHVPEAKAIVSVGNREESLALPAMKRALGGERFLFTDAPATGPYNTRVTEMAFSIDPTGFGKLRGADF